METEEEGKEEEQIPIGFNFWSAKLLKKRASQMETKEVVQNVSIEKEESSDSSTPEITEAKPRISTLLASDNGEFYVKNRII